MDVPIGFIQELLAPSLLECALMRLEEEEAPDDIRDLLLLYSWCSTCGDDPPMLLAAIAALDKSGWHY